MKARLAVVRVIGAYKTLSNNNDDDDDYDDDDDDDDDDDKNNNNHHHDYDHHHKNKKVIGQIGLWRFNSKLPAVMRMNFGKSEIGINFEVNRLSAILLASTSIVLYATYSQARLRGDYDYNDFSVISRQHKHPGKNKYESP
ncbi:hypothetical protein HZH66_011876 [Vespula vulgaris]|uniref:Uncharacterized protein n=1 Tax=Vespula vulgaris TaxID=7454 RepID=A0A834JCU6_VESVU|nr:hypothetical protein HZH66_011876 [Vespula vulgaris]